MTKSSLIILVSGAARSGKSKYAENILRNDKKVVYIATFPSQEKDPSWKARVTEHKKRRPSQWILVENFDDINHQISLLKNNDSVLIDSLGGIVFQYLYKDDTFWDTFRKQFISTLSTFKGKLVIVIEEVGWALSPIDKASNLFRDRMGELSQELEEIADYSYLIVRSKAIDLNKIY